jgi:hypothetical protein
VPRTLVKVGGARAGLASDYFADLTWSINVLKAHRDERLAQPAVKLAREYFDALCFCALKSVGLDAGDPASVSDLRTVLAPGRLRGIVGSTLEVDEGKSGAKWATRYIRSKAPIHWPPLLVPQPMSLRDDPKKPNAPEKA